MIPFIIAAAAAAAAAYKYWSDDDSDENNNHNLGDFAVWGQPDSGKTTFISRLKDEDITPDNKKQTTSKVLHTNIILKGGDEKNYIIKELVDLPGSRDRLNDWLKEVESKSNIFYIVDLNKLSKTDENYSSKVKSDIKKTVDKIKSEGKDKRVKIIGTHLDESRWKDISPADVNNVVVNDDAMRRIYEELSDCQGVIYTVNLHDNKSSCKLIEDIINDCK